MAECSPGRAERAESSSLAEFFFPTSLGACSQAIVVVQDNAVILNVQ